MKKFQDLPKTIQKTVRYIYHNAPLERLEDIQKVIEAAIRNRKEESVW
ncbi:hypothetical protein [Rossellomorea vietnamensis]|nr:hypothetical protein [Rossellomorea vietnamensis]